MKNYSKQKNISTMGFTLVETLVAIAIFSISITALLSVLGKGILDASYAKDKVVATYLAEEGIEYMKNIRDTYVLYGPHAQTGWDNFISDTLNTCRNGSGIIGCKYDDTGSLNYTAVSGNPKVFSQCNSGNNSACILDYNYGNFGKYTYHVNGGPLSGFERRIIVSAAGSAPTNREIKVTSQVSWTKNGRTYTISFSDNLLKWIGE